jgi:hypothetical protein
MYIEHVGNMTVTNCQTGEVCQIEFKSEGWGGKNRHAIEGYIYESREESEAKKKKPQATIFGTWSGEISFQAMKSDGSKVDDNKPAEIIWRINPMPDQAALQYMFTNFTLQLNHLPDGLRERLAPTDSRLRPDQ